MNKSADTNSSIQTLINKMELGNEEAIITGIHSQIPIVNINAIIFGTRYKCKSEDFIQAIKNNFVDSDASFFGGIMLSDFAKASLHILNVTEYDGDREMIKRLIDSDMTFK